jgi:uncharacterized protein YecT (DUF1311 family)
MDLKYFAVLVALLAFPVSTLADPSLECSVASSNQVETGKCLAQMEERVENALEAAMQVRGGTAEKIDEITGRTLAVPALKNAQATWAIYRDAQCEFVGTTFGGGSGTGIAMRACRVELGRARIRELLDF